MKKGTCNFHRLQTKIFGSGIMKYKISLGKMTLWNKSRLLKMNDNVAP